MRVLLDKNKRLIVVLIALQVILLLALTFIVKMDVMPAYIILFTEAAMAYYLFDAFDDVSENVSDSVRNVLGSAASEAYITGGVGLLIYDDDYVITWMSDLFAERNLNEVGQKVLTWLPEVDDLVSGKSDSARVKLDDKVYEIRRKEDEPVLFFKDITRLDNYETRYANERTVIGLASFDNYDESTLYADEADASTISANIRVPLMNYCQTHNIVLKRLNNSNYLLILNEEIYQDLHDDHFSILSSIRKTAQKLEVSITLSLAFARGTADINELDQMAANLMELAQTRGGDQVATQVTGEEVVYYGGSSEAHDKRSRVRVRVMSHSLRDLITKASNVIICGHKMADFDCIGSAIGISKMAEALHVPSVIISKTGGIEEKLMEALKENGPEISKDIRFVTEGEALNQLTDNTLVIMADHHNIKQSNGSKVLESAKKIVVIDHHRRSTETGVKPILIYIEAGASSTCELVTEMIPYVSNHIDLSELQATFMLTGMIVDTQSWRVRTGARTYDAARSLKEFGADSNKAYGWLKDSFDDFALKAQVAVNSERYPNGTIIACVKDRVLSRSLMSQVADSLLSIQNVKAAFVIAHTSDAETAISARSTLEFNVQNVMEKMKGGGHMTAAALQRQRCNLDQLKQELLNQIDIYLKEDQS